MWNRVKSFWRKPFDFCHVKLFLGQSLFLPCFFKNREAAYFFPPHRWGGRGGGHSWPEYLPMGMPHKFCVAGLLTSDIYSKLKKNFYKEHLNVTWEEFLLSKFGLWIDACSSTNNTLHSSGRAVEKTDILFHT